MISDENFIEELANKSYAKYSADKMIDTYEGYQYTDGFIAGYKEALDAKNQYKEGVPEDKDRLCIFFDGEYYIDTFNNLSSSEQKQLIKWCYLPTAKEG